MSSRFTVHRQISHTVNREPTNQLTISRLLSYIFPIQLLRTSSPYNLDIRVSLDHGEPKLLVNGSRQSGAYIKMLWEKAFAALPLSSKVDNILVLGIGGGTVIKLLSATYPSAQITGVDIDQTIINISNTYFGLDSHIQMSLRAPSAGEGRGNLSKIQIASLLLPTAGFARNDTFHVADAAKFLPTEIASGRRYDLVIVDLFSGREIPAFVNSAKFIHNIKLVMRPDAQFVINYLRELEYAPRARAFRELLKKEFAQVNSFEIYNNIFFSCALK